MRPRSHRRAWLASFFAVIAWSANGARADTKPQGVVLVLADVNADAAIGAARDAGGAIWRSEAIAPTPALMPAPPNERATELRRLYLEADFLRCMSAMQTEELSVDALLREGHIDLAATVTIFGAACAHGAGDLPLAGRILQRLFAASLNREALRDTTPEFQRYAERLDEQAQRIGEIELRLDTRPAGAGLELDGRAIACDRPPCLLALRPGLHVVRATRLGHVPRVEVMDLTEETETRTLALDPAPAAMIRAQLAAALGDEHAPDRQDIAAAAADAFGARVVVVVWREGPSSLALVYDRGLRTTVARARASTERAAIEDVIEEWRGVTEPRRLVAQPAFWLTTITVAAAAAVAAFFLTRPTEKDYVLAFP